MEVRKFVTQSKKTSFKDIVLTIFDILYVKNNYNNSFKEIFQGQKSV